MCGYHTRDLIGPASDPPREKIRVPIAVHPGVVERLRTLLFEPEMQGVGYSEFIDRACEVAESQIAQQRTRDR